jgi:hypothetical protein
MMLGGQGGALKISAFALLYEFGRVFSGGLRKPDDLEQLLIFEFQIVLKIFHGVVENSFDAG